jgi:hypothetical protein
MLLSRLQNRGEGIISERKKPFSAFLRVYRSIFKDVYPEPNPDTCVDSDLIQGF